MRIQGRWRIIEMEVWDREAIDVLGPAFIELTSNGQGSVGDDSWLRAERAKRPYS